jgi:SAM-dependent methyltransferase
MSGQPAASASGEFDPVWEEIYRGGHVNRYPWDAVVTFVHRHRPKDRAPAATGIVEIGCGTASNLWFAAREGFRVAGVDASAAAIEAAKARFAAEGLKGDLRVASMASLPFPDQDFDLAIDRAALTCVGDAVARQSVAELRRVLRPQGIVFCNVYSDRHSSRASGRPSSDGLTVGISAGSLVGVGQIRFYDRAALCALFAEPGWTILSLQHLSIADTLPDAAAEHAEWRLVARRN